jgi:hypothetical protein
MPEVSRFYGIVIKLFYDDHNRPTFTRSMESMRFSSTSTPSPFSAVAYRLARSAW